MSRLLLVLLRLLVLVLRLVLRLLRRLLVLRPGRAEHSGCAPQPRTRLLLLVVLLLVVLLLVVLRLRRRLPKAILAWEGCVVILGQGRRRCWLQIRIARQQPLQLCRRLLVLVRLRVAALDLRSWWPVCELGHDSLWAPTISSTHCSAVPPSGTHDELAVRQDGGTGAARRTWSIRLAPSTERGFHGPTVPVSQQNS